MSSISLLNHCAFKKNRWKPLNVRLDTSKRILSTLPKNSPSNLGTFLLDVKKNVLKKFLWTRRRQFRQPCQFFLTEYPKKFSSKISNCYGNLIFFQKYRFLKNLHWTLRIMLFWQRCRKLYPEKPIFVSWKCKTNETNTVFRYTSSKSVSGQVEFGFEHPAAKFG